jgi:type IV pilus assembly protein PilC
MVKAGETGGQLHLVLERYALYLEQQEEIRRKIQSALLYPMILLVFGIVVIVYILSTVIPKFVDIFFKAGVELPWATMVLYSTGLLFKEYWIFLLLGAVMLTLLLKVVKGTKTGRELFDRAELAMPVLGPLKRKVYLARFSRSLATLLESGVSLLLSLDIVGELLENTILSRAVMEARRRVEDGEPLARPLEKNGQFPADIVQMVTVGEESGRLSEMLSKTADFYDGYIDHAIKRLLVLIEPILVIIMAFLVGIIMASVILPLFDMIKTIH